MIRIIVCIAVSIALFPAQAPAGPQRINFAGTIDYVLVDNSPVALAGKGVGAAITGAFRYDSDPGMAVVVPHLDNETDYSFSGPEYGATLYNTAPVSVMDDVTVVVSDNTGFHGPVAEIGAILGVSLLDGDPFDGWTVRTEDPPVQGVAMGLSFFGFTDTGLLTDQDYIAEPPAEIGGGGFDGAVFFVLETDGLGGTIFMAIGSVDSYHANALIGDLDGDGFVGINDLNAVLSNWNLNVPPGDILADPTGDGFVGIDDLNAVLGNWNSGTPPRVTVPEPAGLCLIIAATLMGVSRRMV